MGYIGYYLIRIGEASNPSALFTEDYELEVRDAGNKVTFGRRFGDFS